MTPPVPVIGQVGPHGPLARSQARQVGGTAVLARERRDLLARGDVLASDLGARAGGPGACDLVGVRLHARLPVRELGGWRLCLGGRALEPAWHWRFWCPPSRLARNRRGIRRRRQSLGRRRRHDFGLSPIDEIGRGHFFVHRPWRLRAGNLDRILPDAPAHRQGNRHGKCAGGQPPPKKIVRGCKTDRTVYRLSEVLAYCHFVSRGGTWGGT